jgi:uncharacterized protein with HEPN domain
MKDEKLYLINIQECIEKILKYTTEGKKTFLSDAKTQDAVYRNFEIIGEAVKRISEGTRNKYKDIQWKQISGFRDILIHQYEGIDPEEVWNIVETILPALKTKVSKIINEI